MRALQLVSDRNLEIADIAPPDSPGEGEVEIEIGAVALNHIDVWGWRGMAFAKRKLPLVVGAEAAGTVVSVGPGVDQLGVGQRVAIYGAQTCGTCRACREGRENLCENVGGIHGFHLDGFARERMVTKARLCVPVPDNVGMVDAACASITFGTVEHMLFDNAELEAGETILVQAGGSGIGTAAIRLAKHIGATVITTVGSDEKAEKARALGADHVINYRTERFEGVVRKLTRKRGVDVVFEHTGVDTWQGSLFSLTRGGRLVTCGSTTGITAQINLMQLFQQQYRIFGSFGCAIHNLSDGLAHMAEGVLPVVDTVITLDQIEEGLARLESRKVFGKIVMTMS
ncbi:zinc-binding dehydrogenase [Amorphus sp. 3PC139-8]|uniref:zinc-binding dehydrogenase n=1 Tax=Amorphus sp. 3PC139-8 TaxID=2735676 RepID=UPI00345D1D73